MLFLREWQHTRDRQRHAVVIANSTPGRLCNCCSLLGPSTEHLHKGHSTHHHTVFFVIWRDTPTQPCNVCVWVRALEKTRHGLYMWLKPRIEVLNMFQMTPSARFLGTLKSPWGRKDCEMTLLRSLDLLRRGKTLSKFYNDWLLWTVTVIISH